MAQCKIKIDFNFKLSDEGDSEGLGDFYDDITNPKNGGITMHFEDVPIILSCEGDPDCPEGEACSTATETTEIDIALPLETLLDPNDQAHEACLECLREAEGSWGESLAVYNCVKGGKPCDGILEADNFNPKVVASLLAKVAASLNTKLQCPCIKEDPPEEPVSLAGRHSIHHLVQAAVTYEAGEITKRIIAGAM